MEPELPTTVQFYCSFAPIFKSLQAHLGNLKTKNNLVHKKKMFESLNEMEDIAPNERHIFNYIFMIGDLVSLVSHIQTYINVHTHLSYTDIIAVQLYPP